MFALFQEAVMWGFFTPAAIVGGLLEAFNQIFTWPLIGWLVLGVLIGIIVGALPGVGASLGMAILLPLTLYIESRSALILLVTIYSGAMYGGSISAILINAPGTGGAAATTFDGYPMTRAGKATTALATSATSSALGGSVALVTLILISPILIELVLLFGSPEYFLVAFVGLAMITIVAKASLLRGLLAGAYGMLLATIGVADTAYVPRFTFGNLTLYDGLSFIAVLIGLFAISEMIKLAGEEGGIAKKTVEFGGSIVDGIKITFSNWITMLKSAYIGMGVGAIPGSGSSVANFVAYAEAMRASKNPEGFGKGDPKGVVAPEASNNGSIGGSLIPTLAFGIPGSGATAVLLGGLLMHGLKPGPTMFQEDLGFTLIMLAAILFSNVIILSVGLGAITRMSYITKIDTNLIIPLVVVLAFLGGFSLRNNWLDVATILIFGILGFYMVKHNYSIIAMVLGVILGPIAEVNLFRSLQISNFSLMIFVTRPLSLLLVAMLVFVLLTPFIKLFREQYNI